MNFSHNLREYRERDNYTQEDLAEKIYVSRQTISKWENDKSYPDIHNLIVLSVLFQVSIDELVKGDIEAMKKDRKKEEVKVDLSRDMKLSFLFMFIGCVVMVPAMYVSKALLGSGWFGYPVGLIFLVISMYYTIRLSKARKGLDLKTLTVKQVMAISEGRTDYAELGKPSFLDAIYAFACLLPPVLTLLFGLLWMLQQR